jgi:8-oxo-dGTP pyrophosphatase MutT (NUDIX family)
MEKLSPAGEARTVYSGKLFRVVLQPMRAGDKYFEFERVIRPPGTRLIIARNKEILITREYRAELDGYDYRLPGGKVFDSFEEYETANESEMTSIAEVAAKKECLEETGLVPKTIRHYCTSRAGATIDWDLYYFVVEEFEEGEQQLEDGEHISVNWYSLAAVRKMCFDGSIKEDRTVGILLKFLEDYAKN